MGESRKRSKQFREHHPLCCFCGDPTETKDHVPPRAAFIGKVGPEGFEFPACEPCNFDARKIDQLLAFYARALDRANTDAQTGSKLISGMANNFPEWLPNAFLTANDKRRAIKNLDLIVPKGVLLSDLPIIELPEIAVRNLQLFGERLLAALYYKHVTNIATSPHGTTFTVGSVVSIDKTALLEYLQMLPDAEVGTRRNTNVGSQFFYRWGRSYEDGAFAFVACFGNGLIFFAGCAPMCNIEDQVNWRPYEPLRKRIRDHVS